MTAVRGHEKKVHNKGKVKLLKDRPKHLQREVVGWDTDNMGEEEDDEDMDINLTAKQTKEPTEEEENIQEEREEIQEERNVMQEDEADPGGQEQPQPQVLQLAHASPRREQWKVANGPWREKTAKPSPRERKKRQQAARKRDKEIGNMPYQLRSRKGAQRDE